MKSLKYIFLVALILDAFSLPVIGNCWKNIVTQILKITRLFSIESLQNNSNSAQLNPAENKQTLGEKIKEFGLSILEFFRRLVSEIWLKIIKG
jgi:hypothetical protein